MTKIIAAIPARSDNRTVTLVAFNGSRLVFTPSWIEKYGWLPALELAYQLGHSDAVLELKEGSTHGK